MKKKLGPLETWQWLAIGAAFGVIYYIYKARKANAAQAANVGAASPSASTGLGPIDPTTGDPYALEAVGTKSFLDALTANSNPAQNSGPTSLQQELSDLGQILTLLSGAAELPRPGSQTPTGGNGAAAISTGVGQLSPTDPIFSRLRVLEAEAQHPLPNVKGAIYAPFGHRPAEKAGYTLRGLGGGVWAYIPKPKKPAHNPGHTTTQHPTGKTTVKSSAPHNSQQHRNIAPPQHQRHQALPSGGARL